MRWGVHWPSRMQAQPRRRLRACLRSSKILRLLHRLTCFSPQSIESRVSPLSSAAKWRTIVESKAVHDSKFVARQRPSGASSDQTQAVQFRKSPADASAEKVLLEFCFCHVYAPFCFVLQVFLSMRETCGPINEP